MFHFSLCSSKLFTLEIRLCGHWKSFFHVCQKLLLRRWREFVLIPTVNHFRDASHRERSLRSVWSCLQGCLWWWWWGQSHTSFFCEDAFLLVEQLVGVDVFEPDWGIESGLLGLYQTTLVLVLLLLPHHLLLPFQRSQQRLPLLTVGAGVGRVVPRVGVLRLLRLHLLLPLLLLPPPAADEDEGEEEKEQNTSNP